jgi:hypothetical protein
MITIEQLRAAFPTEVAELEKKFLEAPVSRMITLPREEWAKLATALGVQSHTSDKGYDVYRIALEAAGDRGDSYKVDFYRPGAYRVVPA